jgi:hypothetical protein
MKYYCGLGVSLNSLLRRKEAKKGGVIVLQSFKIKKIYRLAFQTLHDMTVGLEAYQAIR